MRGSRTDASPVTVPQETAESQRLAGESRRLAVLALLLQTLISAGTYLIGKATLRHIPALALGTLRFTLSSILFGAILLFVGRRAIPPKGSWKRILVLGFLAIPLNQAFFLLGLEHSVASHAALLYTFTPVLVLLIAARTLGEPIRVSEVVGIAVALVGVLLVLLERGLDFHSGTLKGDLLLMVAVLAWAFYTVQMKPLIREHGALLTTAWSILAGSAMFLPFGTLALRGVELSLMPPIVWIGLVYLVVITTVIAYLLWTYALRHLEAARVAVFTNLQPVVTALLAWWILSEPIGFRLLAGGVLVILGVWITQR